MIDQNDPAQNMILDQARLLAGRLERLSADSIWAHRASGVRGALLKSIEACEKVSGNNPNEDTSLRSMMSYGFQLLEKAALELLR